MYERVDDHTKNFSFLLREGGAWELAPAYDLTGYHVSVADGDFADWVNPHVLSVNGRTSRIGDEDLLAVAARFGLGTAPQVLQEVKSAVGGRNSRSLKIENLRLPTEDFGAKPRTKLHACCTVVEFCPGKLSCALRLSAHTSFATTADSRQSTSVFAGMRKTISSKTKVE